MLLFLCSYLQQSEAVKSVLRLFSGLMTRARFHPGLQIGTQDLAVQHCLLAALYDFSQEIPTITWKFITFPHGVLLTGTNPASKIREDPCHVGDTLVDSVLHNSLLACYAHRIQALCYGALHYYIQNVKGITEERKIRSKWVLCCLIRFD